VNNVAYHAPAPTGPKSRAGVKADMAAKAEAAPVRATVKAPAPR
jgi:hypothetical protein